MLIKEKLKKPLRKIKNDLLNLQAMYFFYSEKKTIKRNEKIKVGFICQYIPGWNKLSPIYKKMKENPKFEVVLVCVPNCIENGEIKMSENYYNDTYEYYISRGYEAIDAYDIKKKQWLDLKTFKFDYVFFSRPYNAYMPKEYSSKNVCRYTKICSVLYAINMTEETRDVVLNKDFYRNVYCYFAETMSAKNHNYKNFKLAHKLGLQKTCFYGMPALEQIVNSIKENSLSWKFSNNKFRVMWTPRWTTELHLGGSNFFTYYKWLITYAKERNDIDFLIRPHPLMFDNFVNKGLMSAEEVENYKHQVSELNNIEFDKEKEYINTFWESDVLVSDTSSMVAEYFVTGKPLVFCMSNMILEPEEHTKKILEGCYVVNNSTELKECLERLSRGEDILKGKRREIIQEVFGDTLYTATDRIVNELIHDKETRVK